VSDPSLAHFTRQKSPLHKRSPAHHFDPRSASSDKSFELQHGKKREVLGSRSIAAARIWYSHFKEALFYKAARCAL
jgi:hypothetical protein